MPRSHPLPTLLASTALAALLAAGPAAAQQPHHQMTMPKTEVKPFTPTEAAGQDFVATAPWLWDNLGSLTWPVTTANSEAQKFFDQGLRLAYGFNHAEAQRAFRHAQRLDPACAMCYWGEALVLGPNINMPMDPAANPAALAALARAQEHAPHASAKEQAVIAALAKRYSADPAAKRAVLDTAYADAMAEVAAKYPDDQEIATLYAEAMMDLSPWDYWLPGGTKGKGRTDTIVATLERVLKANPDHPGAIHFYIHTVEASDRPERAEPYADRLRGLMPGAGHVVHMPSHIYYRVGRYQDSLTANKAAVAADEAYLARAKAAGIYPQGYYPHNIHFLLVSAQMAGDAKTAVESAEKLAEAVSDEGARRFPWVQPIKAAPYFAHAQFSAPDTILKLAPPPADMPYVMAMWHYARGVGQAAKGDVAAAQAEAEAIETIEKTGDLAFMTGGGVPAQLVLQIARHTVLGRIAQARGDVTGAIKAFSAAKAAESQLPYMEPPFWYYPVSQSLGAALLQAGRHDEAAAQFAQALKRSPNSGWVLYGLMEAQAAAGNKAGAARTEQALGRAWIGDRNMLDLSRL